MRPFPFALSIAAGAAFFFLLAKVLFFGLMFIAPLALMAAIVLGIRRRFAYGGHYSHYHRFAHRGGGWGEPLGQHRRSGAEPLEDYRTIVVE